MAQLLLEAREATLSSLSNGDISPLARGSLQVAVTHADTAQGKESFLIVKVGSVEVALASGMQVITQGAAYIWPYRPHEEAKKAAPAGIPTMEEGGYVKLELESGSVEEREMLESLLSAYTSLADPSQTDNGHSRLVLMDESNGDIVGDLAMPFNEENDLQNKIDAGNDKDPVVVSFDGTTTPNGTPNIQVNTLADITAKYGQSNSKIVGGAEYLSRGIIYGAEKLGSGMSSAASSYTTKTAPTKSPLVFSPTVKTGLTKVHGFSSSAFEFTSRTLNAVVGVAGSVGTRVGGIGASKTNKDGSNKPPGAVRSFIGSSFTAVNTLLDSADAAGKHLLSTGGDASATVVGHRFGPDAAQASRQVSGSLRHVVVVYIDAKGVARRALVKGFGKSAVTAQFSGNGQNGQIVLQPEVDAKGNAASYTGGSVPLGQPSYVQDLADAQSGSPVGFKPTQNSNGKVAPPIPANKPY